MGRPYSFAQLVYKFIISYTEAIVIKQFHPKEGASEGVEKVLSSCSINFAAFSVVINIFLLPYVLLMNRVHAKPTVF